jgi:hypothetical protein
MDRQRKKPVPRKAKPFMATFKHATDALMDIRERLIAVDNLTAANGRENRAELKRIEDRQDQIASDIAQIQKYIGVMTQQRNLARAVLGIPELETNAEFDMNT